MNIKSIRIVNLDSYMSSPIHGLDATYSEFRASSISQVPVLRLFGSIPTGQKICLHIHGVFPYLYIPYDGSQDAVSLMYRIASNIDRALNISLNQATSTVQHVYKIALVQGIPMYGYHNKEHQFFKISLYNPILIRKLTVLLMNETTLGSLYQPHEAHIPYTLQFMIDYNLHGMSNMLLSSMKFRGNSQGLDIEPEFLLPSSVCKMSCCELEGDCLADDILNREEVASGNIGANPGISALWADEQQRRRNKGLDSQIEHLLELNRTDVLPTNSHLIYRQSLRERLAVFSDGKNVVNKLNSFVYPAETPNNFRIQNASMIDSQASNLTNNSLVTNCSLNETLEESEETMNMTLEEDVEQLLHVLTELEKEAKENIEEDSILTQLTREDQEEKDMGENELDYSVSVEAATTPTKIVPQQYNFEDDSGEDDLLNTTLIPQLDGCCDESLKEFKSEPLSPAKTIGESSSPYFFRHIRRFQKAYYVKIVRVARDMPDLDADFSTSRPSVVFTEKKIETRIKYTIRPNYKKLKKRRKLTRKEKKEKEIQKTIKEVKTFTNKIKKLKRQDQLAVILKKLYKKDKELILYIQKNRQPRFRVISKDDVKPLLLKKYANENKTSRSVVLRDIIEKMDGYIDPTLHLIVKYPNHCCYLFNYNNNFIPEVVRIPRKVCQSYIKQDLGLFVKVNSPGANWFLNEKHEPECVRNLYPDIEMTMDEKTTFNVEENTFNVEENEVFYPKKFVSEVGFNKIFDNVIINILYDLEERLKMHMKCLISPTCKQEEIEITTKEDVVALKDQVRRSKRILELRNKIPLSVDGAFDSDSSSDGEEERKKKNCKTPKRQYKALPITLEKSPKVLSSLDKEPAIKNLMSFTKTTKEDTPPVNNLNQNAVCDMNVKRQLFEKDFNLPLSETIVEEKLSCAYSFATVKNSLTDIVIETSDSASNEPFNINENSNTSFHQPLNLEEASNSSTIFNTDSDSFDKSFFHPEMVNNGGLTVAEKYDKETNYTAKEGCSKFITPQSTPNEPIDPSQKLSGSSSSDFLTPYQQDMPNLEVISEETADTINDMFTIQNDRKTQSFQDKYKIITLMPKFSAPSREEVLKSLDVLKIPHVLNEAPFYSRAEDVTGSVEVGFNTLKINSKTTVHLPDFESQTDSIYSFRKSLLEDLDCNIKLTKSKMSHVLLSYCSDELCIITPVKKPPSLKVVQDWLEQKSRKVSAPEKRIERVKVRVPVSPGAKSDDEDMNLTLTLSPATPESSQSSQSTKTGTETPRRSGSPVLGGEFKKRKREIRQKILAKSLRSSLSLSEENSLAHSGQITGITINNSYLNKSVANLQDARAIIEHQNLTVLVMELHIRTRGDLKPDPAYDSIRAIFYSVLHDVPEPNLKVRNRKGVIAINNLPISPGTNSVPLLDGCGVDCDITYVDSEDNLITEFLKIIDYWDPDIFAGYEIELLSWGYLVDRGYVLGENLKPLLGRIKDDKNKLRYEDGELKLTGRILLDVWRLMRHEISLQSYTFESIAFHILQKRFPYYSFKDLCFWWDHRTHLHRHRTVKYYLTRVEMILELFDKLDFLGRTSELARLFGIQFFEVLSRGSQFRVESMMLRLAKPLNYVSVSPSVQQRAHMKAPEYIALVMEPESKLYSDPVIVLDFQSLYPSIIIAYNYCFTTCIGRIENLGKSGPFEFGATQLKMSRSRLRKLLERDQINFSPCGAGFVKKGVRDGIMPRMLREILDTRLMVKNSMKENREDKVLQRVLHNRQLGLKLIANVTYGYTAANFSGRMPLVELGDSVVSKGRETLQRAVEMVDNTPEWGARVVYGDTDSLFVLVPGRTKEHAFDIGKKIADAVTKDNPDPIKLKLEKVYQPCILQTKKRYVGYMYESSDQKDPVYEAKGIETVRRDGCPAVSKMLEKCLRILFETKDVSMVKDYVLKQFNKIIAGRASIQDLTFAKEYRGASGYKPGACVPALELARKWTAVDKRNEPRSGERVPYVIINGPPGLPLIRMVRSPRDLLNDASLKPNAVYYITRVIIPPINRCFNLIGADLHTWFNQMPRKKIQYFASSVSPKKKSTISQYFSSSSCVSCDEQTQSAICQSCCTKPQSTVFTLMEKLRMWETNYQNIVMVCQTCTSSPYEVRCISLDCPVYYRRIQTSRDEQQSTFVRQSLSTNF